ncbi:hypothetical protein [uncultured Hymenobacter sp.]|uniref:hypothetical protein n=1 Tax=uncultured Hymenobacter sp. TaxID=170016 RepID=UPI0035CC4C62
MRKQTILALALLTLTGEVTAQSECPKPQLRVLREGKPVPLTGSAFASSVTLEVTPDPACSEPVRYRVSSAELTLVRNRRPLLAALVAREPRVDLRPLASLCKPGDRIQVFIPYQNLTIVSADGSRWPYPRPKLAKAGQFDLVTDESRGISFSWLLLP